LEISIENNINNFFGGVAMRRIIMNAIVICVILLTGCEKDSLIQENKILTDQLNETNKQIEILKKDKDSINKLNEELSNTKEQLKTDNIEKQQLEYDLNRFRNTIIGITNVRDFQYEIISKSINREPHDKVVFIKNVPDANKDQTFYLLKAALLFSNDETKIVTFWRDRSKAILYANGKYNPEEGPLGWSGFEFRFGSLMNDEQNPKLRQYNSSDDSQLIDFGKFVIKE
jgi:outer membrane murein-binding lipoprotein Lpp